MRTFEKAERYDRHAGRLGDALYRQVVADVTASGLPPGARVLDVGTGPGRIPRMLAATHPDWQIDAVDLEPRMIEFARRQDSGGTVTFTVGDGADLPYPDATFDLIVSSMSQHHWSDVPGVLSDLHRVLKPGGRLWIYDARWSLRRAQREAGRTFKHVTKEPVRWKVPILARLAAS